MALDLNTLETVNSAEALVLHSGLGTGLLKRPCFDRLFLLSISCLLSLVLLGCSDRSSNKAELSPPKDQSVTAVFGPSWLKHLGVDPAESRMGKLGGIAPAALGSQREPDLVGGATAQRGLGFSLQRFLSLSGSHNGQAAEALNETFRLSGADLYRLNCQACHGRDGKGAPPEINSLIGPVEGASSAKIMERMQRRGTPVDKSFADQLAAQAEAQLLGRLQEGGKKMPPFRHLRKDEIAALLEDLNHLANVPVPSGTPRQVPESAARAGEHVIKGTCHICHDATGPGRGTMRMGMMQRRIPSLASLPQDYSLGSVIRLVQYGSVGMMKMMGGPAMPAMPFLTEEEIAAAYFYLVNYPPQS